MLSLDPLLLGVVVIGFLYQLRLGVSIFCLNILRVLVLARLNHCLLLRGVLNVTVSVLVASIDSLSILRAMPRLPRILMRLTSLALAAEGALLRRRVPRTAVHGARLILIHLILSVVVALLSLKALEVRILPSPNLVLTSISQHILLGLLLRVLHILLALLELLRCLGVHLLMVLVLWPGNWLGHTEP